MHMMPLWVNLPRKDKMAVPGYQPITAPDIPEVPVPEGGRVRVIAGRYGGARGPAHTFTPITMLDVQLAKRARLTTELPKHHNAMAVVAEGQVRAGGVTAGAGHLVLFANEAVGLLPDRRMVKAQPCEPGAGAPRAGALDGFVFFSAADPSWWWTARGARMWTDRYRRNVGRLDRRIRVVVEARSSSPLSCSRWRGEGDSSSVALAVIGLAGLVSGITGGCPVYVPFGICTIRPRRAQGAPAPPLNP
jgi:hypothetical protein